MTDDLSRQPDASRTPRPPKRPQPDAPVLVDAWPRSTPFPLNGWLERNGFAPIWTALIVFVLAFIVFQVVGAIAMAVGIIPGLLESGQTEVDPNDVMALMTENKGAILVGNTVGQFLGFALLALIIARLHTRRSGAFLRLRMPDWPAFVLAAVGWIALVPALQWLGRLNQMLPQPQWLEEMEAMQMDLIEGVLTGGDLSTAFLFFALAITPSLCEELLFRGYLQRQVERKWGAVTSIVLVGFLFGLYHLRLTQLVPLSLLGIWMGYVVWASGSLWTGMLVHVLNNGFAVLVSTYVRDQPDLEMSAVEEMVVPWYLGIAGLLAVVGIGYGMWMRRRAVVGATPDARAVATSPSLPSPVPVPS
ncbi:MAG: CPBP family intramembrane glutamic endopeptidase [Bacteroidota bacterium]